MSFYERRPDTEEEADLFEQLTEVIKEEIRVQLSIHRAPEDMADDIAFDVVRVFEVTLRPVNPPA